MTACATNGRGACAFSFLDDSGELQILPIVDGQYEGQDRPSPYPVNGLRCSPDGLEADAAAFPGVPVSFEQAGGSLVVGTTVTLAAQLTNNDECYARAGLFLVTGHIDYTATGNGGAPPRLEISANGNTLSTPLMVANGEELETGITVTMGAQLGPIDAGESDAANLTLRVLNPGGAALAVASHTLTARGVLI